MQEEIGRRPSMIAKGIAPVDAVEVAMCSPITDDRELQRSIKEII